VRGVLVIYEFCSRIVEQESGGRAYGAIFALFRIAKCVAPINVISIGCNMKNPKLKALVVGVSGVVGCAVARGASVQQLYGGSV